MQAPLAEHINTFGIPMLFIQPSYLLVIHSQFSILNSQLKKLSSIISFLEFSFSRSFCGFSRHIVAFIVELFTLTKSDFELNMVALKVNAQGDYGVALLLNLSEKLHNLFLVH